MITLNMQDESLFRVFSSKVPLTEKEFESSAHYFHSLTVDKKEQLVSEDYYTGTGYIVKKGLPYLYKTLDNDDMQVP